MKCSHCGAEYEGNFCPECGARAESQSPAAPPPVQQSTNPVPPVGGNVAAYQKPKKPKKPIYKKWWFYVIAAIALIAIINAISGGKGKVEKGEEVEWSKIELGDQLPVPPSNRGTLFENSDEEFWASLDGVSDDQYNDYLDACVDKGFTVDADKSSYSYKAYNADGYSLDMSHIGDGLSITLKAPMKFGSITWPSSTVGNMLPAPKSTTGKFSYEYDDSFFVYVGETSKADYDQYVADCSAKGFNVDYDKGDTYYRADNADGYHISLEYVGNNIMTVEIKASEDSDTSTSKPETTETSTENIKPDDSTAKASTAPSETPAPTATEPVTEAAPETENGIRPEFQEAMDSYEAFFDEYIAFMKSYQESANSISMMKDYLDYMTQYAETMDKLSKLGEEELSEQEALYYAEVSLRINQKLLEVAG